MFELHQKSTDGPLTVVSTPYGDDVIVVSLVGELDRATVASAARAIEIGLQTLGRLVVVDLQELEFMDSSGVALLVELNASKRSDGRLRVVPSSALGVSRILAVTGVGEMLKFVSERPTPVA